MTMNAPIRLIIADDSPIFRKGLKHFINVSSSGSISIVGEADNGESLITQVTIKRPDVVLTDIQMPLKCGIEASRTINERFSSISVLALTIASDTGTICKMFETGAKGYLSKTADIDEIIEAIKTVHSGEMYYCSSSFNVLKKTGFGNFNHYKKVHGIQFSEREIQFIKLICHELTTKEIADKMKIGMRTVEEYSRNVKEKIEAKNLVGIALYAIKNNIVSTSDI